jgi:transposase-like protein
MESAGHFVTYMHDHQQRLLLSSGANSTCCPVCTSKTAIIRTRRSRLLKLLTQKKRYLCRQCKTAFWAD